MNTAGDRTGTRSDMWSLLGLVGHTIYCVRSPKKRFSREAQGYHIYEVHTAVPHLRSPPYSGVVLRNINLYGGYGTHSDAVCR